MFRQLNQIVLNKSSIIIVWLKLLAAFLWGEELKKLDKGYEYP